MNAAELSVEFREICRYLGYRGTAPTPEVAEKISLCLSNLQKASVLSETHVVLPLESPEENVLVAGEMEIHSKNLYKNMRGCHACCLFAATIGIGCDRLIARAELTSMADRCQPGDHQRGKGEGPPRKAPVLPGVRGLCPHPSAGL